MNPLTIFKHNFVKVFEKILVSKNSCCDKIQTLAFDLEKQADPDMTAKCAHA